MEINPQLESVHTTRMSTSDAQEKSPLPPCLLARTTKRWVLKLLVWLPAIIVLTPVLLVVVRAFAPADADWTMVVQNRLPGYLWQTFALAFCVTTLAILIGVPCAWLVSAYRFPGRNSLVWLLMLPMSMPGYVASLAYVDMLQSLTPLYLWVRRTFGLDAFLLVQHWTPWVFAVLVLATTLFPYVFLSCRAVFSRQATAALESARSLGAHGMRCFFRVALPMARPAVVAGATLVAMETVNDYGVVASFGLTPLTPGIFRSWTEGHPVVAMRLAVILMGIVLLAQSLEIWQRGRRGFCIENDDTIPAGKKLAGLPVLATWMICGLPIFFGFLLPFGRLLHWSTQSWRSNDWSGHWQAAWHSFAIAGGTAVIIAFAAFVLAAGHRAFPCISMAIARRCGALGYAVPGALIAVGIGFTVSSIARHLPGGEALALSASTFGLVVAGFVRYLAVGLHPVIAGFEKIPRSLHDAARSLGCGPLRAVHTVDWPLVRPTVVAGATFAFVDLFKELPLALILRPLDFESLATRVFRLTDEGRIPHAAVPGLAMILMCMIGLIPLTRMLRRASSESC